MELLVQLRTESGTEPEAEIARLSRLGNLAPVILQERSPAPEHQSKSLSS